MNRYDPGLYMCDTPILYQPQCCSTEDLVHSRASSSSLLILFVYMTVEIHEKVAWLNLHSLRISDERNILSVLD